MRTKSKRQEHAEKRLAFLREQYGKVAAGVCPQCGTKLYRNNSLTGWFQCGHFGAPGFQKEAGPSCDFQFFYDPTPEQHSILISEKRLWIGNEPEPKDRVQIVVSAVDAANIADLPKDCLTSVEVTNLLDGKTVRVRTSNCGFARCICALAFAGGKL